MSDKIIFERWELRFYAWRWFCIGAIVTMLIFAMIGCSSQPQPKPVKPKIYQPKCINTMVA